MFFICVIRVEELGLDFFGSCCPQLVLCIGLRGGALGENVHIVFLPIIFVDVGRAGPVGWIRAAMRMMWRWRAKWQKGNTYDAKHTKEQYQAKTRRRAQSL